MIDLCLNEFSSPVGIVRVVTDGNAVRAVDFEDCESRMHRLLTRHFGHYTLHATQVSIAAVSRLTDYFAGDLNAIEKLIVVTNGTPFQRQVWAELRTIPAGTMVSYGEIARRIGRPKAFRAVGLANGANPINIIVPCHRVLGADKTLTGYGGGLHRKQWLLAHEGVGSISDPLHLAPDPRKLNRLFRGAFFSSTFSSDSDD